MLASTPACVLVRRVNVLFGAVCGNVMPLLAPTAPPRPTDQPAPRSTDQRQAEAPPPRPRAPAADAGRAGPGPGGLVGAAVGVPLFLVRSSFRVLGGLLGLGASVVGIVGDRVLPPGVMRQVRRAAAALAGPRRDLDAAAQAQRFIDAFGAKYGEASPR